MSHQCSKCDSKCCRYFCFQIDEPDSFSEFDDIRWYLCHDGVTVHIDEGDWYISIANRCRLLSWSGRCTIYEERPVICRNYDTDNCDYTDGNYEYEALFETPEQLEEYARKTLGAAKYDRAMKKARAKAAGKTALTKKTPGKKGQRPGKPKRT